MSNSHSIFLTGASGFVGANLLRRLVSLDEEVHILLRKDSNPWRIRDVLSAVTVHEGDLRDGEGLERFLREVRPKVIYHLGVYGAYPFQTDVNRILQTNILGTANLIQAAAKVGFDMFVNTGTSSEYGFKSQPALETDWLDPNSYYAVSKASATMFCRYTATARALPIVTLRLFSVYGPYEEPTRFIPTLITSLFGGKLPPLVAPQTARDFIYIDDVVEAYLRVVQSPVKAGEVFNVGSGVQTSIEEVVALAMRLLNQKLEPHWETMPGRIWDTSIWVADISRIREVLGWTPRHSLEAGIGKSIAWFREHRDLYETREAMVT